MDIHKPKAAHSLREFAVEIGTIICGILIALGLEQAVERLRVDREVSEAREALRREMAHDAEVATRWQREYSCWITAADAARAWAAGGGNRPSYAPGLMSNYQTVVWDTAKTGAVTQMSLDDRLELAKFYQDVSTDAGVINNYRSVVTEMGGYLEQDHLTAEDAGELARLAGRMRWLAKVELMNGQEIVAEASHLNVKADPPNLAENTRFDAFCQTLGPPRI